MDVTPNKGMLEAMEAFTDGLVGERPHPTDHGPGAQKLRAKRRMVMDWLHNFSRLNMREGVGRHLREFGHPTVQDEIKPSPLKPQYHDSESIAGANDA